MIYNIFISHSWSYSDYYDKLKSLLDSESSLYYRDYSVPKDALIHNSKNDRESRAAIKNQMQHA